MADKTARQALRESNPVTGHWLEDRNLVQEKKGILLRKIPKSNGGADFGGRLLGGASGPFCAVA
jgi:hypothetical protein